jgi:hypothetical protein
MSRWLWLAGLLAALGGLVALLLKLQGDIEPREGEPDGPPLGDWEGPRPPRHD